VSGPPPGAPCVRTAHRVAFFETDGAEPEHVPLVEIVHAADTIAAMIGGDDAADALSYPTDRDVMQRLGLDAAGLAGILCATLEEYEELGPLLAG
jgi:hypothetical protein